ncbi:helix-turn-helix domain-containing protein [Agrobacterium sp. CG674]
MTTLTEGRESTVIAIDTKSTKLSRKGEPLSRLALLIEKITATSNISQREIAAAAGFKNQNMITMIKQGDAKLPLDRAPAMARALGVDPLQFLDMAFEQYFSDEALQELRSIMPPSLTPEERKLIDFFRESGKKGKGLNTERIKAIRDLFE